MKNNQVNKLSELKKLFSKQKSELISLKKLFKEWKEKKLSQELFNLLNINSDIELEFSFFNKTELRIHLLGFSACSSTHFYKFTYNEKNNYEIEVTNILKNKKNSEFYDYMPNESVDLLELHLVYTQLGLSICKGMTLNILTQILNQHDSYEEEINEKNKIQESLYDQIIELDTKDMINQINSYLIPVSDFIIEKQIEEINQLHEWKEFFIFVKEYSEYNTLFKISDISVRERKNRKHYKFNSKPISKKNLIVKLKQQFTIDNKLVEKSATLKKLNVNLKFSGNKQYHTETKQLLADLKILINTSNF